MLDRIETRIGQYKMRLTNTGNGSEFFGPCEICGKHCSEHWLASAKHEYEPGQFTGHGMGEGIFGHRECVEPAIKRRIEEHREAVA